MLSLMAQDFFAKSPVLLFPVIALFLFLLAFAAITWRTLRKDRGELERLARLPLDDDDGSHETTPRAGVTK